MTGDNFPRIFSFHKKSATTTKWLLIIVHVILGLVCNRYNGYITLWILFVLVIAIAVILRFHPNMGYAYCMAGYFVSFEVILRLLRSKVFWEFGKYSTLTMLLLGIFAQGKIKSKSGPFMIYFFLLLPSIFGIDYVTYHVKLMDAISSKLSGPLLLCVSAIYFVDKKINLTKLKDLVFCMFLPFVTLCITLAKNLSQLSGDAFANASNFQLTNNFGPNQVSCVLGLGMCLFYIRTIVHSQILPHKSVDWVIMAALMTFSLLTFSRGGPLSAGVSIILCLVSGKAQLQNASFKGYMNIGMIILASFVVFYFVNNFTKGALLERYQPSKGQHASDPKKNKYFTGRDELFETDLKMFQDNLVYGVGVGMSKFKRGEYGAGKSMLMVIDHTEFSRMMSEHGLFGLASMMILFFTIIKRLFLIRKGVSRSFCVLMSSYALTTLSHSSMRLALPSFLFGLAFIKIYETDNSPTYL